MRTAGEERRDQRGERRERWRGRGVLKTIFARFKGASAARFIDVRRDKGDVSGRPAPMENGTKSIKGPKIDALCNCFVLGIAGSERNVP